VHFAKLSVANAAASGTKLLSATKLSNTATDDERPDGIRTQIETIISEHDLDPQEKLQDLNRLMLEWRHDEQTLLQHVKAHYQLADDVQVCFRLPCSSLSEAQSGLCNAEISLGKWACR
jgi:hypothetical protein